jgi:excisionase family DNA binding protein
MRPISDYLTIGEAAKRLGVSASTLRSWTRAKAIPFYRNPANQYLLYLPSDLDAYLARIKRQSPISRS